MRVIQSWIIFSVMVCLPMVAQARTVTPSPMTLEKARQVAVGENLDLMIARMERKLQALTGKTARRPFVPVIFFNASYDDDAPLVVDGLRTRRLRYGGGVRWLFESGTQVGFEAQGVEVLSASALVTPSTVLALSLTQPLLRGAWGKGNTLAATDLEEKRQRWLFIEQLNALIVDVDSAYWGLSLAQEDVSIKKRSLERAQKQYDETKENIRRGLLAKAEIYVVEENLNLFKQSLLRSEESRRLAQIRLGRLLQIETIEAIAASQKLYVPASRTGERYQGMSKKSLKNHPSIKAQHLTWKQASIQQAFEANQIEPSLDFVGQLQLNGQGSNSGAAWLKSFGAALPDFSLGLVFEVPLVRAPDYARVERAALRQKQASKRIARAKRKVVFDVKSRLVQLIKRRALLTLSTKRVALSKLKLATEKDKYLRGYSSLDNIVRFQRDVDSAFITRQRLLVDLLVLETQLSQSRGTLHTELNMEIR